MTVKSYKEWSRNPSLHGSYDDYVSHMKGIKKYLEEEKRRKNNEELAELIAIKVTEKMRDNK